MKRFLFTVILCLFALSSIAQSLTVRGTLRDAETQEPIPGVAVQEKGTQTGTYTDKEGNYALKISSKEATLVYQLLGYARKEVSATSGSLIDIWLQPTGIQVGDVVVTALALERSTKDLGYAVQRLNSRQISAVKSPNFVDNLAGKVAGVTISQGATGVGSTSRITIRGEASFTNNNPLFVVDGTPINNNSVVNFTNDAAAGFQEVDFGNGGMEINADDIASVNILKGPSAAALYGTRASNGVVIISTKDGAAKPGIGVSFNTSTFVEKAFQLPEFQNRFGQGNSGQFEFVDGLGGGTNDNITYSWGPALDQGTLISQFDSPVTLDDGTVVRGGDVAVHGGAPITPTPFVSQPDNLKNFYQTGFTTTNNLAISSGFDKGDFRLSYTDTRSKSIIPGVNLDRKNAFARFNFRPTERLKVSSTVNYVNSQSDNRPSGGYGSENINYSLVAWGPRSLNTESLEDYWQPGLENVQQYAFNYTFFDNPYFILKENRNSFNRDRIFGNIVGTYEFTDHLSLSLRSGMDYSTERRKFRRAFSSNRFKNGAYAEHDVSFRENNTDILLNYNRKISDFGFGFSAGANRMDQSASTTQTQALTLAQPGIFKLSNAASPLEVFQYDSQKRINSIYGLLKLSYQDFLYLDVTARNDWSSALATPVSAANTSFFYPSFSGSFILSNVVDLPKVISFAKVRASWAQVGNDTDPYQTAGTFTAQTPVNSLPTFSDQSTIANAALLPERTTSMEVGADLRFFEDRLRFDITAYNALTTDQIISLPIPISSGYTERVVNGGEVRSKGLEIIAGVTPIINDKFRWDATLNFSRNVTTVESLPDGAGTLTLAYSRVYDNVNQTVWFQVQEGGQIGDMYGTGYETTDDGQFILDDNGNFIANNDLELLGNYNPDFILGIQNQFSWKDFNLGFLLDWRQGGVLVSRTLSLAGVGGQLIETEDRPDAGIIAPGVVNVGTATEPQYVANTTAITAESYYRQFYDRNHEVNNVYDASYLKLRQVSFGYTWSNPSFLKRDGSLSFALIGRNLFAISEIPHFDPEQLAVQGNRFVSGVEDMSYATTRSYGIRIGFDF